MFEELERVKAERDQFYDKILVLKARLDNGKSQRLNQIGEYSSREGFCSGSLRNGVTQNIMYQADDVVSEQPPAAESSYSNGNHVGLISVNNATVRNVQSVGELLVPDTATATFSHDFQDIPSRNQMGASNNT